MVPLLGLICIAWVVGVRPVSCQSLIRDFVLPLPLFAPGSAWNAKVTNAAVLPESEQQILALYRVLRGNSSSLSFQASSSAIIVYVNYDEFTVPIFPVGTGEQVIALRDYEGRPGSTNIEKLPPDPQGNTVTVPASAGMVRPSGPPGPGSDGWLVLYEPSTSTEYDYWQATTAVDAQGNSLGGAQTGPAVLAAGAVEFFDVRRAGVDFPGYFSAHAVGTPLLAGLLLPEDVESGTIAHALAFAIPGPRNTNIADPEEPSSRDYFPPASSTESQFFNSDPLALAPGQRIRLKPTIVDLEGQPLDESQLAPITRMFLAALRTYGAYLVDGAGGFTFYAEDTSTASFNATDDRLNELIGEAPGTPLAPGKSKWQIVMEALDRDLFDVPLAYGPWQAGQDPSKAAITTSNFDVVTPFQEWHKTYFAHLGNGQGLVSEVVLTNPSSTATALGSVRFLDDEGFPASLATARLDGVLPAQTPHFETAVRANFSLPPLGAAILVTDGQGEMVAGSGVVVSNSTLGGVLRFSLPEAGIAGVGASRPMSAFMVPVRREVGGVNTGIAVANTGGQAVTLDLELRDSQGRSLASASIRDLAAGAHTAKFINELFAQVNRDAFEGTLVVRVSGGKVVAVALELGSQAGEFTTLPTLPLR